MERVLIDDTTTLGDHPGMLRNVQEGTRGVAVEMRDGLELAYCNSKAKAKPEV